MKDNIKERFRTKFPTLPEEEFDSLFRFYRLGYTEALYDIYEYVSSQFSKEMTNYVDEIKTALEGAFKEDSL
jgi:hypothetical protein